MSIGAPSVFGPFSHASQCDTYALMYMMWDILQCYANVFEPICERGLIMSSTDIIITQRRHNKNA